MDDHPRILAQFPGELAMPDIDGVDPGGSPRQQHVGKAAGRSADVERRHTGDGDREMVECRRQLDAAARHPGMVRAGDRKRGFLGERGARLVDAPSGGGHQAGEDQRLGFRPCVGEAALDEKLIGSPLRQCRD